MISSKPSAPFLGDKQKVRPIELMCRIEEFSRAVVPVYAIQPTHFHAFLHAPEPDALDIKKTAARMTTAAAPTRGRMKGGCSHTPTTAMSSAQWNHSHSLPWL